MRTEVQKIIYVQVANVVAKLMEGGGECSSFREGVNANLPDYAKDEEIWIDLNGVQRNVDS